MNKCYCETCCTVSFLLSRAPYTGDTTICFICAGSRLCPDCDGGGRNCDVCEGSGWCSGCSGAGIVVE